MLPYISIYSIHGSYGIPSCLLCHPSRCYWKTYPEGAHSPTNINSPCQCQVARQDTPPIWQLHSLIRKAKQLLIEHSVCALLKSMRQLTGLVSSRRPPMWSKTFGSWLTSFLSHWWHLVFVPHFRQFVLMFFLKVSNGVYTIWNNVSLLCK